MTGPTRREIEKMLENAESDDVADRERGRVHVPPEQRRRIQQAFEAVGEPIDPERVAELFVYGPDETDGPDFTDAEAAAVREIDRRQRGEAETTDRSDDAHLGDDGSTVNDETNNSDTY